MYNQTTTWIPLLGTFFIFQQIASALLWQLGCFNIPDAIGFNGPIESRHMVFQLEHTVIYPFPILCFTLICIRKNFCLQEKRMGPYVIANHFERNHRKIDVFVELDFFLIFNLAILIWKELHTFYFFRSAATLVVLSHI